MLLKTAELKKVINALRFAVSKNDAIPILKNICFRNDSLITFNGSIGAIYPMELETAGFMVPFDKFAVFVNSITKDEVEILVDDKNITLKAGKASSVLPFESDEDYFNFDEIVESLSSDETVQVNYDFVNGLKLTNPFASKSSSRLALCGVYLKDDSLSATDGMRIANCKLERTISTDPVIFPTEFSKVVASIDKFDGDRDILIQDSKCIFYAGDYILFGNLMDGTGYPSTDKFFPEFKKDELIALPKQELMKALKTVGDFTGEVIEYAECLLSFGENISISYAGETASIQQILDFGKRLPKGGYNLNPYHLSVMLSNCDKFLLNDSMGVFYGESEDGRFKSVVAVKKKEKK